MIRAACEGAGQALLPRFAADEEPALARASGVVLSRELWLMVHEDQRARAAAKAVIDWIDKATARAARAGPTAGAGS